MKLSTKGRYAVMAMADLATNVKNKPISLTEISLRQNISLSYLEQLFLKLRSKFKAECFAENVKENGVLVFTGPVHSLTHIPMKFYSLTEKTSLFANINSSFLPSNVVDSPIVEGKNYLYTVIGLNYSF